jgi:hypothetical protein
MSAFSGENPDVTPETEAMSTRASRWLLWITFACVVPLPFFLIETGCVPALRLLMLGGVALAILATEGTQGVVGILAALLIGQALLQLVLLWGLAWLVARGLGRRSGRRRAAATLLLVVASLAIATSFDLYHTPFRTRALRGSLLEIFE